MYQYRYVIRLHTGWILDSLVDLFWPSYAQVAFRISLSKVYYVRDINIYTPTTTIIDTTVVVLLYYSYYY